MKDEKVVLIIDEAQHLSAGVLEELRLLTNFETHRRSYCKLYFLDNYSSRIH